MFPRTAGTLDRVARIILGLVLGVLAFTVLTGVAQVVTGIVAIISLLTGASGFCPIEAALHVSTRPRTGGDA
jgi:hypothetical protein